ncbi:hypothetical protein BV898_10014 [Hypsibius exemplaris]|uniref:Uncharacterized protein n=1 Tax=Hypsibius exemplaris TaxID=2072580 RepID=A0A1W0WL64_HYPEX|nr:hypothetical protein BV898_10014 [Hypsibius exemplaris]
MPSGTPNACDLEIHSSACTLSEKLQSIVAGLLNERICQPASSTLESVVDSDREMLRELSEVFNLPLMQMLHAVFVHDGSFFDAVVWLSKRKDRVTTRDEMGQGEATLAIDLALVANNGHCPLHPDDALSHALTSRWKFL